MLFRPGLSDDLPVVAALLAEEVGKPASEIQDRLQRVLSSSSEVVWVACLDGRTVGAVVAQVISPPVSGGSYLYVDWVIVEPGLRGQGLGKGLMDVAAKVAGQRGCSRVVLDAKGELDGFYAKLGYRRYPFKSMYLSLLCGYSSKVEHGVANAEAWVRFPLPAPV